MDVRMKFKLEDCVLIDAISMLNGIDILVGYTDKHDIIEFTNTENPYPKEPPSDYFVSIMPQNGPFDF